MNDLQKEILQWYKEKGRKLPWRETTNPYYILVSEIMLQQTQVDRVIPKYNTFLKKFPQIKDLAEAKTADILKLWSGLGYNRRALYLQKCAQAINEQHNGQFPKTQKELLTLPGIGKYTSAAVLSFAYNTDIAVVDVNIEVLMKRIFFSKFSNPETAAQYILPKGHSRDWHNALMDIGAQFCTAKNPKCNNCPITSHCASANNEERIQATWKKKKVKAFKDSDRIVRGNILKILTEKDGQKKKDIIKELERRDIKRDKETFNKIISKLEKDNLIKIKENTLFLP